MGEKGFYEAPIVMLSALEDQSIINEALNAGANEYGMAVTSDEAVSDE